MAVFTSSVLSLRRKMIREALRDAGAFGPENAKALAETNLINPDTFREYTGRLADTGVIRRTPEGKYYLDSETKTGER